MSDLTKELLKLINDGKTIREISETLNLSYKQIYNILSLIKNRGFDFERRYYDTGDIVYVPRNPIENDDNKDGIDIITKEEDNEFTFLAISDLHLGNELAQLELLDKVYDYCIQKGIHVILNGGDLIDGMGGQGRTIIKDIRKQIEYLLKYYPFDKSILNFTVLGNHDYVALEKTGQDLASALYYNRHDIVSLGYGLGRVNVKDDSIFLKHSVLENGKDLSKVHITRSFILIGHSHRPFSIMNEGGICNVKLPTLSNLYQTKEEVLPSAIKITLKFSNNQFCLAHAEQLLIGEKVYAINKFSFPVISCKKGEFNNVIKKVKK